VTAIWYSRVRYEALAAALGLAALLTVWLVGRF
jgi:hypothetical protein